jgi:hypothetical protein
MKSYQIERRKWIVASSAFIILCMGSPIATAHTDAPGGGGASGSYQGTTSVAERVFNNPIIEQVTIVIANRATMTPSLIQGPASVIENLGGFGQVIPTTVTVIKSTGPTILTVVAAIAREAAYG